MYHLNIGVGDKLAELERVVKRKDDYVIPPSDKQMIVGRKLGDFLTLGTVAKPFKQNSQL